MFLRHLLKMGLRNLLNGEFNMSKNSVFLTNELINKIENVKYVSFDIFDTLLVRPYVRPTDMFLHMEKAFNISGFCQARIDAEKKARRFSNKVEVTLDDIYGYISGEYSSFKKKEEDFEYKIARINPIIEPILNYVRKRNKTIVITSSMYLSQELLCSILRKIGVSDYKKIYISNVLQANKDDSTLYNAVLNDLKCSAKSILHIGDNQKKDIEAAEKLGLKAHFVPKLVDYYLEKSNRANALFTIFSKDLDASILVSMMAYYSVKNGLLDDVLDEEKYFNSIGYLLGGSLAYQFLVWIGQECKKNKIQNILFVARDGYSLSKMMNIINPEFVSKYVYAPRKLSLSLSMGFNENSLDQVHCVANFYKKEMDVKITKNNENFPVLNRDLEFIHENSFEISKIREKYIKDYISYMKSLNIDLDKFAVVDTATLWATCTRLFSTIFPKAEIYSYFWRENMSFDKKDMKIYFFDDKKESHSLVLPYDIVEFLFTAPEPSVSVIKNNKPVYNEVTEYEKIRNKLYPFVSDGILGFAYDIKKLFPDIEVLFSKNMVFNWMKVYMNTPSNNDLYFFQKVKHAGDVNHSSYKMLFPLWYRNKTLPIYKNCADDEFPRPFSNKNNIPIICAASNGMAIMLGVAISSLKEHSNPNNNYDIFVLHTDIDQSHQLRLLNLQNKNISIRFIDMNDYVNKYKNLMVIRNRMSISTYFRFFIPTIFKHYKKCLWLDADILVRRDVAELFNVNVDNYFAAACTEFGVQRLLYTNDRQEGNWRTYVREQLSLHDATKYFSAGIMVWNIEKISKFDFLKMCFEKLATIPNPYTYDQDVLNHLFQGNVLKLDAKWNMPWNLGIKYPSYWDELPEALVDEYQQAYLNPCIIHYCGAHKPWYFLNHPLADVWWSYARKTEFYEEIVSYKYATKSMGDVNVLKREMIDVHFPNINNHFAGQDNELKLLFVNENIAKFILKKFYYKLRLVLAFSKKKKDKYKQKYGKIKTLLKEARKQKKRMLKV